MGGDLDKRSMLGHPVAVELLAGFIHGRMAICPIQLVPLASWTIKLEDFTGEGERPFIRVV